MRLFCRCDWQLESVGFNFGSLPSIMWVSYTPEEWTLWFPGEELCPETWARAPAWFHPSSLPHTCLMHQPVQLCEQVHSLHLQSQEVGGLPMHINIWQAQLQGIVSSIRGLVWVILWDVWPVFNCINGNDILKYAAPRQTSQVSLE